MGSRLREDEKNEKIIRALLKQTPNKRCINCNSLGPQYVCLNFWTFVCTTCSGIHREFTHRVKSVSMSKFTSSEVSALQNGGNEHARDIYFKEWDSQRQPLPDSSNVERLRDFIKSVYVDKRFSGERPLPRGRGGDRNDVNEIRRSEPRMDYRAAARSPSYEDQYEERRLGARRSDVGFDDRRFDARFGRNDEKRSPGRFDTDRSRYEKGYNDNRRYEEKGRYGSRDRLYEDHYNEGLDRRFVERFTRRSENVHHRRELSGGSPPSVRSVKEILGDNIPPLRVEDHTTHAYGNGNGNGEGDMSHRSQDSRGQKFGSSSSFGSLDGSAPVHKRANSGSLIDFNVEPETPAMIEQPDPFGPPSAAQLAVASSSNTGWATFDAFTMAPASTAASAISGAVNNTSVQINGSKQLPEQWAPLQAAPAHLQPPAASPFDFIADGWSVLGGTPAQPPVSLAGSNQAWNAFPGLITSNPVQSPATVSLQPNISQELPIATASVAVPHVASHPSKQRHAIPEDFFISSVSGGSLQNMSLQVTGDPASFSRFNAVRVVGIPGQIIGNAQPSKPRNPFDAPEGPPSMPIENAFPSLNVLQTALPRLNVGPMQVPDPGVRVPGPQWFHSSLMAYPPAAPTGGGLLVGQQTPTMVSSAMQAVSVGSTLGVGNSGNVYGGSMVSSDSPFPQQGPPRMQSSSLGPIASDYLFPNQGGSQLLSQNMLRPAGGNSFGSDSLFPNQGVSYLHSENMLRPVGGNQQHFSQSSLGSLGSNMFGSDSFFPAQAVQHPTQNSLGPIGGNPFG